MVRKTKYVKGDQIYTIGHLAQLLRNRQWIYWCDPTMTMARPKHPAWLRCMSLEVLEGALAQKQLCHAIPRDEAVVCGYGDCGNPICRHRRIHLPENHYPFNCNLETHYCDWVFGPVRCIPLAEYEARHA